MTSTASVSRLTCVADGGTFLPSLVNKGSIVVRQVGQDRVIAAPDLGHVPARVPGTCPQASTMNALKSFDSQGS
ncbi:MAG: hypothetical protein U0359_06750 [Byssovorax sp.]